MLDWNRFRGRLVPVLFTLAMSASSLFALPDDEPPEPADAGRSFQAYIFWAYGLACAFLLLFWLWTAAQSRGNARRLEQLRERFESSQRS